MEWVGTVVATFIVLLLLGPLAVLVVGVLAVAVLGQVLPASPRIGRTTFICPFSKRTVNAEFLSWPEAQGPADVLSCSAFSDPERIRCKKGCLGLARTSTLSSPMMPRFALIAGGTAYRA